MAGRDHGWRHAGSHWRELAPNRWRRCRVPGIPAAGRSVIEIRGHVARGEALYREAGMADTVALDMLRHHHERHDGSGYPQGLAADAIPLHARIAGIVDSYDAMITTRPFREALSRHDALQRMYRERGRLYQDELIEEFMQSLGVYPCLLYTSPSPRD